MASIFSSIGSSRIQPSIRRWRALVASCFCLASGGIGAASVAHAEAPAVKLLRAPLVTPSVAQTYYGASTTHTAGLAAWSDAPPEIKAAVRSFGGGRLTNDAFAQNAADYVRNNIRTEFRFGLGKGGRGALIDQSGTPFDQAELMVKILRQGGVSANYQVGVATLTAQQFGAWTGLVHDLDPAAQTFVVDAKAACQFLADGAIPATVNGYSDCDLLSGSLSTVSLEQVWVSANGKLYDPSFKTRILTKSIDLAAAMGCGSASSPTCGSGAKTALLTGAIASTISGSPALQTLNETSVNATLKSYAIALQHDIQANHPVSAVKDIVGGGEVDVTQAVTATASLPYGASALLAWSGEVPDQYRTTLSVQYNGLSRAFYADELAGRRLRVLGGATTSTATSQNLEVLYVDDTAVQSAACTSSCAAGASMVLAVNHPYAASSGAYADETVTFALIGATFSTPSLPFTIIQNWGDASAATEQFYADLQKTDPSPFADSKGASLGASFCGADYSINGHYSDIISPCRNDTQPTYAAKLLSQGGEADRIVAGVSGAALTRHHVIGVVFGFPSRQAQTSYLTLQSDVSVTAANGDASARSGGFETSAALWSALEGSVQQQVSDSVLPYSSISHFIFANRANLPIVDVAAANVGTTSALGYGGTQQQALLQAAAAAGYDMLLIKGASIPAFTKDGLVYFASGGDIPERPDLFHKSGGLAYLLDEAIKGGANSRLTDPAENALKSAERANYAASPKNLKVNLDGGGVTLEHASDLVTGSEGFPFSLSFQRTYRGGVFETAGGVRHVTQSWGGAAGNNITTNSFVDPNWTYSGADSGVYSRLGGGWSHNFDVSASLDNSGLAAMGKTSALNASAFIAGVYALNDLLKTPSPAIADRVSAIFVTQWLSDQLLNNTVVVDKAGKVEVFQRLPDGIFNSPTGSKARLAENGDRSINSGVSPFRWNYSGITLTYDDGSDGKIQFTSSRVNSWGLFPGSSFKADSWTFPNGVVVNFQYSYFPPQTQAGTVQLDGGYYVLSGVSNNLGRSLSFGLQLQTVTSTIPPGTSGIVRMPGYWMMTSVADETGRAVTFDRQSCPQLWVYGIALHTSAIACDTLTATSPTGAVSRYGYAVGTESPDPAVLVRPNYLLRRWYTPGNTATPYLSVAYDDLVRVKSVTDILGKATQYYPGALSHNEHWKRGDKVSPLGELTTTIFDDKGGVLKAVDALGRTGRTEYDALGRKTREFSPELGQTRFIYDVRGNLLETCLMPKASTNLDRACDAGAGDLVTKTAYVEAKTVWTCANLVVCNQPLTETDARNNTTSYSWDTTTGQLTKILKPTGAQTDLVYDSYAGTDGGTLRLLGRKIEKVSDSQNIVTTYAYDTANKFVLKSATVDPGGAANSTTCFKFDVAGNLIGTTDPRAGAGACP